MASDPPPVLEFGEAMGDDAKSHLRITTFSSLKELEEIQGQWESVYADDDKAHFFVSWIWIRGWFETTPDSWIVLVAECIETDEPVAFLPLKKRTVRLRGIPVLEELHMGGKPFADLTGFVSLPEWEEEAMRIFARYVIRELKWNRFYCAEVLDPRIDIFLRYFDQPQFDLEEGAPLTSPCVELGASWDEHMTGSMSGKARSNVRRAFRKVECETGFRWTVATEDDLDTHVDALLRLWVARWGDARAGMLEECRRLYRYCLHADSLWVSAIWDGEIPMAAASLFVDRIKLHVLLHLTTFDAQFSSRDPGRALLSYCLRKAIDEGYRKFDFLLGDEDYKYSFGATDALTRTVVVVRKSTGLAARNLLIRGRDLLREKLRRH